MYVSQTNLIYFYGQKYVYRSNEAPKPLLSHLNDLKCLCAIRTCSSNWNFTPFYFKEKIISEHRKKFDIFSMQRLIIEFNITHISIQF